MIDYIKFFLAKLLGKKVVGVDIGKVYTHTTTVYQWRGINYIAKSELFKTKPITNNKEN
jgi:hypothetical protein